MRSEMYDLVDVLKSNQDTPLFNDSGIELYMLDDSGEKLITATSQKNFHEMTEIELHEFIKNLQM